MHKTYGDGRWFPGSRQELTVVVERCLSGADVPEVSARIVGAIAPHAGYVYSGPVAGYTFRALRDNAEKFGAPETVVVLGFSHRAGFKGVALLDGDAIESPIGKAELDVSAANLLASDSELIRLDARPHMGEHSAENEIPFVQISLPNASLVVGLIGDHETETREALVTALLKLAKNKRIVVVASTDLLHDPNYERVSAVDKKTLRNITALDVEGLKNTWSYAEQVCCGIGPVLTVMQFAKEMGAESGKLLRYRNSGDDHPESRGEWVVGYGAVVFATPIAK